MEERIRAGIMYDPADPELRAVKLRAHKLNIDYNNTYEDDVERRCAILSEMIGEFHPLLPNERNLMMTPDGKRKSLWYARPVKIGNNCWLGASVTVCPRVSIGDNCVIGAGSVVTGDIPPDSLAAGVPRRVIRQITEADSMMNQPDILADCSIISDKN